MAEPGTQVAMNKDSVRSVIAVLKGSVLNSEFAVKKDLVNGEVVTSNVRPVYVDGELLGQVGAHPLHVMITAPAHVPSLTLCPPRP